VAEVLAKKIMDIDYDKLQGCNHGQSQRSTRRLSERLVGNDETPAGHPKSSSPNELSRRLAGRRKLSDADALTNGGIEHCSCSPPGLEKKPRDEQGFTQ
jgi:hypothetical protein